MKKRVLITGITGMVGSHLADFLLANTDWDIFGMCRWRSPLDNVAHLLDRANKKDRLFFIDGDLCDLISLENAVNEAKPDYVFHRGVKDQDVPKPLLRMSETGGQTCPQSSRQPGMAKLSRGGWACEAGGGPRMPTPPGNFLKSPILPQKRGF